MFSSSSSRALSCIIFLCIISPLILLLGLLPSSSCPSPVVHAQSSPPPAQARGTLTRTQSVATDFSQDSDAGFGCSVIYNDKIIYGTLSVPGALIKFQLPPDPEEAVTTGAGSTTTSPFRRLARIVANSGEDYFTSAIRDGDMMYTGTFTDPARVVKWDLYRFQRVDARSAPSGVKNFVSAALPIASHTLLFGSGNAPGQLFKVYLGFTIAQIGVGDSGEGSFETMIVSGEKLFVGCGNSQPGKIAVFQSLSTFTKSTSITLGTGENNVKTSVEHSGFGYFGIEPNRNITDVVIVKIYLFTSTRVQDFSSSSSSSDSFTNGAVAFANMIYFASSAASSDGKILQLNTTMDQLNLVSALAPYETNFSSLHQYNGFLFAGTAQRSYPNVPQRVVQFALPGEVGPDFLTTDTDYYLWAQPVKYGNVAFWPTYQEVPGRIMRVDLETGQVISPGSPSTPSIGGLFACVPGKNAVMYCGNYDGPAKVLAWDMATNTEITSGIASVGENSFYTISYDDDRDILYGLTYQNFVKGYVVKFNGQTLERLSSHQATDSTHQKFYTSFYYDSVVWIGAYTAEAHVIFFNVTENSFGTVALNAGYNYVQASMRVDSYGYFASGTGDFFAKVNLVTRVMETYISPLGLGNDFGYLLAHAGFAFLTSYKTSLVGNSSAQVKEGFLTRFDLQTMTIDHVSKADSTMAANGASAEFRPLVAYGAFVFTGSIDWTATNPPIAKFQVPPPRIDFAGTVQTTTSIALAAGIEFNGQLFVADNNGKEIHRMDSSILTTDPALLPTSTAAMIQVSGSGKFRAAARIGSQGYFCTQDTPAYLYRVDLDAFSEQASRVQSFGPPAIGNGCYAIWVDDNSVYTSSRASPPLIEKFDKTTLAPIGSAQYLTMISSTRVWAGFAHGKSNSVFVCTDDTPSVIHTLKADTCSEVNATQLGTNEGACYSAFEKQDYGYFTASENAASVKVDRLVKFRLWPTFERVGSASSNAPAFATSEYWGTEWGFFSHVIVGDHVYFATKTPYPSSTLVRFDVSDLHFGRSASLNTSSFATPITTLLASADNRFLFGLSEFSPLTIERFDVSEAPLSSIITTTTLAPPPGPPATPGPPPSTPAPSPSASTPSPPGSRSLDDGSASSAAAIGGGVGGGLGGVLLIAFLLWFFVLRKKNKKGYDEDDEISGTGQKDEEELHDVSVGPPAAAAISPPLQRHHQQQQQAKANAADGSNVTVGIEPTAPFTPPQRRQKTPLRRQQPDQVQTQQQQQQQQPSPPPSVASSVAESPAAASPLHVTVGSLASPGLAAAGAAAAALASTSATDNDVNASLRAASICASVVVDGIDPLEAVDQLETMLDEGSNAFASAVSSGSVRAWCTTLQRLPPKDVGELQESAGNKFCGASSYIFTALQDAPFPVGTLCALLGEGFRIASRAYANQIEAQILAQRTTRLLPVLIRASQNNNTAAQGIFGEIKAAMEECNGLIAKFVAPGDDDNENEPWVGARLWAWMKEKATQLAQSPDDFAACHQRLDRVLQEACLAAQLDVHRDVRDIRRSLLEMRQSCDAELHRAVEDLRERMERALQNASAETAAAIHAAQSELADAFARVEAKVDTVTRMMHKLLRDDEFRALEVAGSRVAVVEDVVLGEGGNGTVYLATFDGSIPVAAKMAGGREASVARHMLREARMMWEMRCPGVVMCYGVAQKTFLGARRVFMLMERCQCSVDAILGKAPLSTSVAFHIIAGICSGLVELHRRGIVHRDIKPQNMLLSRATPPDAKLHDFGSSRQADSLREAYRSMSTSATHANLGVMGSTLGYAAPEMFESEEMQATTAADIYSLGISLYVMLTKRNPLRLTRDDLPTSWDPEVHELLHLALARQPEERIDINEFLRRTLAIHRANPLSEDEEEWLAHEARHVARRIERSGTSGDDKSDLSSSVRSDRRNSVSKFSDRGSDVDEENVV